MKNNILQIDWLDNHKNLNYTPTFFKDEALLNFWETSGIKINQTLIYLHQTSNPYPWMSNLIENVNKIFNLQHCSYAFHKITPGNFLPTHSDKYQTFKEKFSVSYISKIKRIIIFLDDGKDGHILTVKNKSYIYWKKGQYVSWSGNDAHLAANLGTEDRYTLQITGLTKD